MLKLSKAYSRYGADMGRRSATLLGKLKLQKIAINSQGYDQGGAYWGHR